MQIFNPLNTIDLSSLVTTLYVVCFMAVIRLYMLTTDSTFMETGTVSRIIATSAKYTWGNIIMRIEKVKHAALHKLVGKEVVIRGTVSCKSRDRYNKHVETMCLSNVWVGARPIHHLWLRSDNNALVKSNQIQGNDQIKFTGIVYEYTRVDGTVSYSVALKPGSKVQLIKAKYE